MFGLGPALVSPDRIGWWWKRARTIAGIDPKWRHVSSTWGVETSPGG
jgi:hypothetical protein